VADGSERHIESPELILMAGYPGVGKSAIAVELAGALRYPLFDIDDIRTEVDRGSGIDDWEHRGWLAYDILKRAVARQTQIGVSVIVDTCLTHQWLRDFMFGLGERHGATIHIVHCHCSDAVAIERNRKRLAENPEEYAGRDVANFRRMKGLFQPIDAIASISLDTERPVLANVAGILRHLDATRRDGGS